MDQGDNSNSQVSEDLPEGFVYEEHNSPSPASENFIETERAVTSPLEELFDIDRGTTMIPYKERTPMELAEHQSYDNKDNEIETQLQEIFDAAMEAYENSIDDAEDVEPKYRGRAREVAAQFLNTALSAVTQKGNIKSNKDKLDKAMAKAAAHTNNGTVNNFFMDRNQLLDHLRKQQVGETALEKDITPTEEQNDKG